MTVQFGERLGWQGPVTQVDTSAKETLGVRRIELGDKGRKVYVYVKNAEATNNVTAGMVCKWEDVGDGEIKRSAATTDLVAGVAISTIAAGSFGWIQLFGQHPAVLTAANTANADALIAATTSAGRVAAGTAPTMRVIGWSMGARDDTANANEAYLVLE